MSQQNGTAAPVTNEEFMSMARAASEEIKSLRAHIQFLAPKAQAYDSLAVVLSLLPQPPQGARPDVAALLDQRANSVEQAILAEKSKPAAAAESQNTTA